VRDDAAVERAPHLLDSSSLSTSSTRLTEPPDIGDRHGLAACTIGVECEALTVVE
jgi:hypothetical protein